MKLFGSNKYGLLQKEEKNTMKKLLQGKHYCLFAKLDSS
jgi:hypothetical protein